MSPIDITDQSSIIVVEVKRHNGDTAQAGLLVDRVREVQEIDEANIDKSGTYGGIDSDSILGLAKTGDDIKILLDIQKTLLPESLSF
jgi:purine-binding chemotaxis protein CheW